MKYLRELFKSKDKKTVVNIGVAIAVGIILLLMSNSFFQTGQDSASEPPPQSAATVTQQPRAATDDSYESALEKRMEEALSQVAGVGKVKVMLTLAYGREIIIAEDRSASDASANETDAQGGSRTTESSNVDEKKIIITDKNGVSAPLILKEVQPKIEGVIIIAEGGDNVFVKDALTRAAETILGLAANKVQVLKMKTKAN